MTLGNVARVLAVLAACVAAFGSASSNNQNTSMMPQHGQQVQGPPPPQQMEPARALGLWRSTFGAVKIEGDNSKGGIESGSLQGVWVYNRRGQEVIGYFAGNLRGNVLQFRWQEPNNPPLTGEGYLVFDPQGRQYSGRWWSDRRDRIGDWNGWRQAAQSDPYGQQQPQQPAYQDPYRNQQQPYPNQQPYQDPYRGQYSPYGGQQYGQPSPYAPQPPRQPAPPRTYY
jgi:hypothetical protein